MAFGPSPDLVSGLIDYHMELMELQDSPMDEEPRLIGTTLLLLLLDLGILSCLVCILVMVMRRRLQNKAKAPPSEDEDTEDEDTDLYDALCEDAGDDYEEDTDLFFDAPPYDEDT